MSDEPTLGEAVRRLNDVVNEIRELRREVAEDRQRMEARFLPRAEFDLAQQSDAILVRGLENEVHSVAKRLDTVDSKIEAKSAAAHARIEKVEERRRVERALLWSSLVAPLIILLVGALIASGRL